MLTQAQINAILANPGSYGYWCALSPTGYPFWSHSPVGHVLHVPTPEELADQRRRAAL